MQGGLNYLTMSSCRPQGCKAVQLLCRLADPKVSSLCPRAYHGGHTVEGAGGHSGGKDKEDDKTMSTLTYDAGIPRYQGMNSAWALHICLNC